MSRGFKYIDMGVRMRIGMSIGTRYKNWYRCRCMYTPRHTHVHEHLHLYMCMYM